MNACIYARTCRREKLHHTVSIDNQVAACRELARRHNLLVEAAHVFMDIEHVGAGWPTCWAPDGQESRPALAAMIQAMEAGEASAVIVHQPDALATSSEVLTALVEWLSRLGAPVVIAPEQAGTGDDPVTRFAVSILRPCLRMETEIEQEQRTRQRARKREEIERLKVRLARLEAELHTL